MTTTRTRDEVRDVTARRNVTVIDVLEEVRYNVDLLSSALNVPMNDDFDRRIRVATAKLSDWLKYDATPPQRRSGEKPSMPRGKNSQQVNGILRAAAQGTRTERAHTGAPQTNNGRTPAETASLAESAARATVMHVVSRARTNETEDLRGIREIAAELIRRAGDAGASVADTTTGVVTGAMDASDEAGIDPIDAAPATRPDTEKER